MKILADVRFKLGQTHTLILIIFLVVLDDFTAKNAKFIAKSAMILLRS